MVIDALTIAGIVIAAIAIAAVVRACRASGGTCMGKQ
jgi:hypothetical protein